VQDGKRFSRIPQNLDCGLFWMWSRRFGLMNFGGFYNAIAVNLRGFVLWVERDCFLSLGNCVQDGKPFSRFHEIGLWIFLDVESTIWFDEFWGI
jgi:hypothetical protein